MTDPKHPSAPNTAAERKATILLLIHQMDRRIDDLMPEESARKLILNIRTQHPTLTVQQARRESWSLLRAGVAHLCDGGPGDQPGLLTTAISKASLRSAALAASVGVRAPLFELVQDLTPKESGHAEAVFLLKRMTEAVQNDLEKSARLILSILGSPGKRPYIAMTENVLQQNITFFNHLHRAHGEACGDLMGMIQNLKPPPKAPRDRPSRTRR